MTYTYWLHEKTKAEISESFAWYEDQLPGLGHDFLNAVENKINEIITQPETFSSKGNPQYREALVERFPFVIVYKIYKQRKEIFISSIHHSKRSINRKYRKR